MSGIYNAALDDVTLENEDQFYRVNPRILALTDDVRLGLKTYVSSDVILLSVEILSQIRRSNT